MESLKNLRGSLTKVKVCGIMDQRELDFALSAGADAVGFVVEVEGSRHSISSQNARKLVLQVPIFVKSVAVIAPQSIGMAESLAGKTGADIIQIHGSLEPENIAILKNNIYQRLIVAINSESQETHGLDLIADAILLDTFNNGKLGGTGKAHDWNMSAELVERLKVPVILAGGLNPNNVVEAVRKVRPYAVDVSSGVETDGRKDPEKINSFIREAKNCH